MAPEGGCPNPTLFLKVLQASSVLVYANNSAYLILESLAARSLSQEELADGNRTRHSETSCEGSRARTFPFTKGSFTPTANWKALRRWNIPENRLPKGNGPGSQRAFLVGAVQVAHYCRPVSFVCSKVCL
jgi:hypothetical protein